jgi:hypothetical protein
MMTRDRATTVALTALLAVTAFVGPSTLAGQEAGRVPLFLTIPESFPEVDARTVLLREPGRDIVLLRKSDATVETLTVALHLLIRLNETVPRREGQGQMVPITGYVQSRPLRSAEHALLEEALTRLKARPVASIGNLGPGRSMPFRLPDR